MKIKGAKPVNKITFKTKDSVLPKTAFKWWEASNDSEMNNQMIATVNYLKESQNYRARQAAIYARLYGNMSLFSFAGSNMSKLDIQTGLPDSKPTFNLIQSAIDTLVARIGQNRPAPTFLTDNSDYKQRNLAKKLNNFIQGELYATDGYKKSVIALRDALVLGVGCLKIYKTSDDKVALERVLPTELFTDPNESIYGNPRQLFQLKLVDRDVLKAISNGKTKIIDDAATAYPDNSADSSKTISDMVMVVEGWHLPSSPDADDGYHIIGCSSGILFKEKYKKDKFPFAFLHYSPRLLGFWSQGAAGQLMGTQMEINALLYTISQSLKLVGVPIVWIEEGSAVVKAHLNNQIGRIATYRGIKPIYETPQSVHPELYEQLQRLIQFGYQQLGVSAMQAGAQKPAGLNSGEAQRVYDDISTDRFATLSKRYDDFFIDLAYQIIELAKEIAEDTGSYQTVYPNKDGTKEIDLPKADLINDKFVIQVFNQSSLPRDPAGRMQKVTEMIQAGMISIKEGRRLLDYPDLEQVEKLANASEERIFKILDQIVEDGIYTPPDPFMELQLANDLVVQYYNLYVSANIEEDKASMLREFFSQVQTLKAASVSQQSPQQPGNAGALAPAAQAEALPSSPLIPNGNPAGAQ